MMSKEEFIVMLSSDGGCEQGGKELREWRSGAVGSMNGESVADWE